MKIKKIRPVNLRKIIDEKPNWTILFLFGFFCGIVIAQIFGEDSEFIMQLFPAQGLLGLKNLKIDTGELLFYVMKERILFLITVVCLSGTSFGILFLWICCMYIGLIGGLVISSAVMQYGFAGSILSLAAVFPQIILYWPALHTLLDWCYDLCKKIHSRKIRNERSEKITPKAKWYVRLIAFLLVVITGMLAESYVNPFVLKLFVKLFFK